MPDIFSGSALPDVTTTKTNATTAPDYYSNYLSGVAGAGKEALSKTGEQLVAPLTDLQKQSYAGVTDAANAYKPGLSAAEQTAATAAAGATPDAVQNFMNPYTHNVVDEMSRLTQSNLQRNLLPSLKAGFVGSGALGSQRYAGALGQSLADVQSNLTGQQYGALSAGYSDAVKNAIANAQLQNQASQTQAAQAKMEQELGLSGLAAMNKAGSEQQAQQQAIINAPLTTATNVSNLMRGYQVPSSTTETYHGPLPGAYSNSPLSQIAGLGTLLASGFNSNSGWGNQFVNWLKDLDWNSVFSPSASPSPSPTPSPIPPTQEWGPSPSPEPSPAPEPDAAPGP